MIEMMGVFWKKGGIKEGVEVKEIMKSVKVNED